MILDALNQFSDNQQILTTQASTNNINLNEFRDIGTGENLYIFLNVDTALQDASGTDSTVTVTLRQADSATMTGASSIQTLFTIAANAAAGTKYIARIQPLVNTLPFIDVLYTVNNGANSAGSVTCEILHDVDVQNYFPSGFVVAK